MPLDFRGCFHSTPHSTRGMLTSQKQFGENVGTGQRQRYNVMSYNQKQRKNRLDCPSMHQWSQSYDLHHDLQNYRDRPTVTLQLLMNTNIVLTVLRAKQAGCCTSLRTRRPATTAHETMRVRWCFGSMLHGLLQVLKPGMHHGDGGWIDRAWGAGACMYPVSRQHRHDDRPQPPPTRCCQAAGTGKTSA